jgi:hypothetical protein
MQTPNTTVSWRTADAGLRLAPSRIMPRRLLPGTHVANKLTQGHIAATHNNQRHTTTRYWRMCS